MPAIYAGMPAAERHARAAALLDRLGLAERTANRPHQLSGGQQQHGADQAAWQVTLGVFVFFSSQRHAFDREEKPDRVRNRRPEIGRASCRERV